MNFDRIPLYFWFEVIALVAGLISFNKLKRIQLSIFVPYLFFIVVYEFGTFNGWFAINRRNLWAANIVSTVELVFYCYIFYSALSNLKTKKIVLITSIGLLIFT